MAKIMEQKGITPSGRRIPEGVVCYSSAIKPLLDYLMDWRQEKGKRLMQRMIFAQKLVLERVFGKEDTQARPVSDLK